ncbi:MAG TPA: amidohydrolase family protein, partial [Sphingomonas sp.]|nr:amidohydrolase family protein [Sphingomonas sp.]
PTVYTKLSEVIRSVNGTVHEDLPYWRGALDEMYDVFGPDRVIYGSNWPSCLAVTQYEPVFRLVHDYFAGKGRAISEKYFWKNSAAAYRWVRRDGSQPDWRG